MSRLAKKPIKVASGVQVMKSAGSLSFKGPKGEIKFVLPPEIEIRIEGDDLWVDYRKGEVGRRDLPKQGTIWSLARNAIEGVTSGFVRVLEIEGVGYRAQVEGKTLVLYLGYAEPVRFPIEDGVKVEVEKNVIKVSGLDKDLVGRVASKIRALKKPEPYKGKGIHYQGEVIRRKVGKKAGTTAA